MMKSYKRLRSSKVNINEIFLVLLLFMDSMKVKQVKNKILSYNLPIATKLFLLLPLLKLP